MNDEYFCPHCGEEMEHWGQGIMECPECKAMIDSEVLDEMMEG